MTDCPENTNNFTKSCQAGNDLIYKNPSSFRELLE